MARMQSKISLKGKKNTVFIAMAIVSKKKQKRRNKDQVLSRLSSMAQPRRAEAQVVQSFRGRKATGLCPIRLHQRHTAVEPPNDTP